MICCNKRHTLLRSIFTRLLFSKNFVDLFTNTFLRVISHQKPILQIRNMCTEITLRRTESANSQSLAIGYRMFYVTRMRRFKETSLTNHLKDLCSWFCNRGSESMVKEQLRKAAYRIRDELLCTNSCVGKEAGFPLIVTYQPHLNGLN